MTTMTAMTTETLTTDRVDRSNARRLLRRLRSGTSVFAVSMLLTGFALTACDDSNGPTATLSDAAVTTYTVGIDGMHCESCVKAITAKIAKVDGVRSCTVDLEGESATVDAVPEAMPTVRTAIAKLGFTVRDPDATSRTPDEVEDGVESGPTPEAGPTDA
jgi:copper chaperone CopZ